MKKTTRTTGARPQKLRMRRKTGFTVPAVYTAPTTPDYRPAFEGARLIDCNLVLEGGAMRGLFTAGVLDFLMDNALMPKVAIGVSAGALNGLNYVAGQRGRSCYLNTKYCSDWRYLSMKAFARTGNALSVDFVFDEIPNRLEPFDYDGYARSPLSLITVSSDLERGEAEYTALHDPHAQIDYLRASASMPLLSQIIEIDGRKLLDGGICDSVPIAYSQATGATKHLVVLTQDAGYVKKPNRFMRVARRAYADYPLFVERMRSRHTEYNRVYQEIARMHDEGEIFVIRPPEPITVASMEHDAEKLYRLWQTGYEEARASFSALKSYLEI